ncbi:hypothetical protein AB0L61_05595 [Streptomyces tendae]|uniref:hypothetical protein n=1 Tax=Streptomyces tendae TaxID=1932 RepID=UPI00341628CB
MLRFPERALRLPSGDFLVSDITRHQLVELAEDGKASAADRVRDAGGFAVGLAENASFSELRA